MRNLQFLLLILLLALSLGACRKTATEAKKSTTKVTKTTTTEGGKAKVEEIKLAFDKGVDAAKKVISVGSLNDDSGPAAAIGKPFAIGKRVLIAEVNAGGTGYLPEGWTINNVERDHGYNPQKSVQAYKEIKDQILFLTTSFGTPPTLPLRKNLSADNVVAFPASLSSKMAEHKHTPPIGPSYVLEAMRAMDWAVVKAGGADKVKAGIIYQQDDYGMDGFSGWKKAAAHHKVAIVSEQTVAPGQKDFAAAVTALKQAGANYVLMTVLPSASGPILGTAAKLQYMPNWIGQTPSWIDAFFIPKVIPPVVFTNFYWVQGTPYWGEKLPGMDKFLKAWGAYKAKHPKARPDFYILLSYVHGLVQLEGVKRAIEGGDITRAGFLKALAGIENWTAGGMVQALNLSAFPYQTGSHTRILKPVMDKASWKVVAGYAGSKTAEAASKSAPAPSAK